MVIVCLITLVVCLVTDLKCLFRLLRVFLGTLEKTKVMLCATELTRERLEMTWNDVEMKCRLLFMSGRRTSTTLRYRFLTRLCRCLVVPWFLRTFALVLRLFVVVSLVVCALEVVPLLRWLSSVVTLLSRPRNPAWAITSRILSIGTSVHVLFRGLRIVCRRGWF